VGKPHEVTCYRGGKIATRAEVDAVLKQLGLERMYSTATLDILRTGR
jgi:ribosomal protein L30/L7E